MNPQFLELSTFTQSREDWAIFTSRLNEQGANIATGAALLDGKGELALSFKLSDSSYILFPARNTVLVDGARKVVEVDEDDDWVALRAKIAKSSFDSGGEPPEPGPHMVAWMRQRIKEERSTQSEEVPDWTYERCIQEAAEGFRPPPQQPSPFLVSIEPKEIDRDPAKLKTILASLGEVYRAGGDGWFSLRDWVGELFELDSDDQNYVADVWGQTFADVDERASALAVLSRIQETVAADGYTFDKDVLLGELEDLFRHMRDIC